jgi:hypothetical protein
MPEQINKVEKTLILTAPLLVGTALSNYINQQNTDRLSLATNAVNIANLISLTGIFLKCITGITGYDEKNLYFDAMVQSSAYTALGLGLAINIIKNNFEKPQDPQAVIYAQQLKNSFYKINSSKNARS